MIKLFDEKNKEPEKKEELNVNFSLSVNIAADLHNQLLEWVRERKEEKLYEKAERDGCDTFDMGDQIFDAADKEARLALENLEDKELSDFIESMYGFKVDLIEFILDNAEDSDIQISASIARSLSSITQND